MKKNFLILFTLCALAQQAWAQFPDNFNQITPDGIMSTGQGGRRNSADSLGTDKEIPIGLHVWTVDRRFGDIKAATPDTLPHMFMNTIFTTGLRGEYNSTGNLGAPRINRVFIDRPQTESFIFTQPYDFFMTPVEDFHFTNTLSPITNITYNNAGDRTEGDDHITAKFAVNANKRLGMGFKFDYLYGRGYYQSQNTSLFNFSLFGSYLGDRYQAHILFSTNHQKVAENGGITDDNYITHPESFNDEFVANEIPTVLDRNWNRNDNQHLFLTHRYSLGFKRKVPMTKEEIEARKFAMEAQKDQEAREQKEKRKNDDADSDEDTDHRRKNKQEEPDFSGRPDNAVVVGDEAMLNLDKPKDGGTDNRITVADKAAADSLLAANDNQQNDSLKWMKDELVPVTSFIHTLQLDNYKRIYQAYKTPADFYLDTFNHTGPLTGDSIFDRTRHYDIRNTFAISMLEGFNKWAKAGIKIFLTNELRHFELPDSANGYKGYNEHNTSIGGQLSKTQGNTLHFNATAETWLAGEDAGQLKLDATADVNFPLFGDTVTLAAKAFLYRLNPTFYYRHYHSKHFWWDHSSMSKTIHSRIQGVFSYKKTRTSLRVALDEIKNHTYFGHTYNITEEFQRTGNEIHVRQYGKAISLITAALTQDFTLGPLNWENVVTFQKSSEKDVLPVPDFNVYSNLFLRFKIAKVLSCDVGGDVRYFTKYYAPDYSPTLGQFTVQESAQRVEVGGYPVVNVYANFHLKHTRFFVMMSHINSGSGRKEYFFTPHYPLNERALRIGLSWNFFN